ncbi:MAG TPA: CocE/NonD family hydrolase [Vicinamibacteria bacterium]
MRRRLALGALAVASLLAGPEEARPQASTDPSLVFDRIEAMVPMRDGVRLHTEVYVPKGAPGSLPILLTRTPYGIGRDPQGFPPALASTYAALAKDGYLFAFQDIRGRSQSEGQFVMLRPVRDPADAKATDEGSDTHDTIEWLLGATRNNGRVGVLGISYGGWLTVMAMLDPHPALKAVSPQASPADMYLGDDFHHNGAFRLSYGFEYVYLLEAAQEKTTRFEFDRYDTYDFYLGLGALSNVNRRYFKGKMPTWNDFVAHPDYDAFWKRQAVAPYLTRVTVPTLNVAGWWDQEDFYGPLTIYAALERRDERGQNVLVVGPWNHGGWAGGEGDRLGRIQFDSPTARHYRERIEAPFFACHLKDKCEEPLAEANTFQTGANEWRRYDAWPPRTSVSRSLFLREHGRLSFEAPTAEAATAASFVSDPAHPVPYRPRPIEQTYPGTPNPGWPVWQVQDQRFVAGRPDVLVFETEPLTQDLTVTGNLRARLFASTTGTDADWVVKLIDVYPEQWPQDPSLGGFQLMVAGDVLRGRYRKSFETPSPLEPGKVLEFVIDLHALDHRFRKGHRVMVQVQSTWFPVIDRNPQTYLPNIFEAKEADYRAATHSVHRSKRYPSQLELPVAQ